MKVGDRVTVFRYGSIQYISKIERETNLYYVVESIKYRKIDGIQAGDTTRSSRIEKTTKAHEDKRRQFLLSQRLRYMRWEEFSLKALESLAAYAISLKARDEESEEVIEDENNR